MLSSALWLATSIVFLNFDGARVSSGAEDAAANRTLVLEAASGPRDVPAFDDAPYRATHTRMSAIAQITERVEDLFAGYDLQLTTTRPAQGPYTMVLIGGRSTDLHVAERAEDGVAVVDCGNVQASNVAFVWAAELAPTATASKGQPVADALDEIAVVTAHELGHTFGLEHVTRESDVMHPGNVVRRTGFYGASPLSASASVCVTGETSQDSSARLAAAVGQLASKTDQSDIGSQCTTRSDCAQRVCVKTSATVGFCSQACALDGDDCPSGAVCTEFAGATYCAPAQKAVGCSALPTRDPTSVPWIFALGVVLLGALKRR